MAGVSAPIFLFPRTEFSETLNFQDVSKGMVERYTFLLFLKNGKISFYNVS